MIPETTGFMAKEPLADFAKIVGEDVCKPKPSNARLVVHQRTRLGIDWGPPG